MRPVSSSRRVSLALSPELLAAPDERSKCLRMSRGDVIRQVLAGRIDVSARRDQALAKVEKRAQEHGLFESGVVKRAPYLGAAVRARPKPRSLALPIPG